MTTICDGWVERRSADGKLRLHIPRPNPDHALCGVPLRDAQPVSAVAARFGGRCWQCERAAQRQGTRR